MTMMRKATEVGKVRYSQGKGNRSVRLEHRVNEENSRGRKGIMKAIPWKALNTKLVST